MAKYDVIVIGGGHNGLTTAAMLGQSGKKVLVLEKNDRLGGLAMLEEFHPGYSVPGVFHDTSRVQLDLVKKLNLHAHGLRTDGKRPSVSILSTNGDALTLSDNVEETATSIAHFSSRDAEAYRSYRAWIDKVTPWIQSLLDVPQPDLIALRPREIIQMLRKGMGLRMLGKKTMQELLKILPMCIADFLNEHFETEFLKTGLAGPALHASFNGPWSAFTTMNLMLWEATSKDHVQGGPSALISALEKAALHHGVEIRTGAEVGSIQLSDAGEVHGVTLTGGELVEARLVAASCTPREVFFNLLTSRQIGPKLEAEILHLRSRGTTAKVNLALNAKIQWRTKTDHSIAYARTGHEIDDVERAFDAVKYRQYSEKPVLDIAVPTASDSSLAPDGHEVVSILAQYAPYNLDGGWTETAREEFGERVIAQLALHTTNLESSIVAKQVMSPVDLESRFNLTGGNLYHAEHAIDQLVGRPVPSCAKYATPIPGLFLCGSGSHPGGGLTCAPGALATQAILSKK